MLLGLVTFCSVTIISSFYDQLMGLFEFPEEVFVSKIATNTGEINLSLHMFKCLQEWRWSEIIRDAQPFTF